MKEAGGVGGTTVLVGGDGDDPIHHPRNVGVMLQEGDECGNHADLRELTAPSWERKVEEEGEG